MIDVSRDLVNSEDATVTVVKTLTRSSWEIFLWRLQGARDGVNSTRSRPTREIYIPRLNFGLVENPHLDFYAAKLWKRLRKEVGSPSYLVVGDSHQETTPVVNEIRHKLDIPVVLSPEGVGVFRSKYGGYPWVLVSKGRYIALLVKGLLSPLLPFWRTELRTLKADKFGFWWTLENLLVQVLMLIRSRKSESLVLREADLLLTAWDSNIDIGIPFRQARRIPSLTRQAFLQNLNGPRTEAVFVHQPMEVSTETWIKVLEPLKKYKFESLMIKSRSDSRGVNELELAFSELLPQVVLQRVESGLAEDVIHDAKPEIVIGVTSTVLLNLAFQDNSPTLICVGQALKLHSNEHERGIVEENTAHQLLALRDLAGDKIRFI